MASSFSPIEFLPFFFFFFCPSPSLFQLLETDPNLARFTCKLPKREYLFWLNCHHPVRGHFLWTVTYGWLPSGTTSTPAPNSHAQDWQQMKCWGRVPQKRTKGRYTLRIFCPNHISMYFPLNYVNTSQSKTFPQLSLSPQSSYLKLIKVVFSQNTIKMKIIS